MPDLPAADLSLTHTLASGQTFCWQPGTIAGHWHGYINQHPCELHLQNGRLFYNSSATPGQITAYLSLTPAWSATLKQLPDEPFLQQALQEVAGLHCVQEDWFECIANFICSSLKQIPQIQTINRELRRRHGTPLGNGAWTFPTPATLARLTENELRECRMGYRAAHLLSTARQIDSGVFDWSALSRFDTPEASHYLQQLRGVGAKVAACILLYAAARYDSFPVDVWVQRLMHKLYFPKRRQPPNVQLIENYSLKLFGPLRGIAQLYLFHWYRTACTVSPKNKPSPPPSSANPFLS